MELRKKTLASLIVIGFASATTVTSVAQEIVLHGPDWGKSSPGSDVKGDTRATSAGNRAPARITASGGKVSALAGMAGSLSVVSTAQANTAGLSALNIDSTRIDVLNNQVQGFVNAVGGVASANSALVSGGDGRRELSSSRIRITDNTARDIDAYGGQGSLAAGAIVSAQLPGRASGNSLLADQTDLRQLEFLSTRNTAQGLQSIGGSALANAVTASRSTVEDSRIAQTDNTGRNVRSGGGSGALGAGVLAQADLTGTSAVNAVLLSNSRLQGARVDHQRNEADGLQSLGGTALANSLNVGDVQGGGLQQYRARFTGNRAQDVTANGGEGSLLMGALADVKASAAALANSVSIQGSEVASGARHTLADNRAQRVHAVGGAAAANSIWLQDSTARNSNATLSRNVASDVSTSGGSASLVGGAVGQFERNGRSLANSLVLDARSTLEGTPATLSDNEAHGVRGSGGLAAANSALLSSATMRNGRISITGNTARNVQSNGFEGSAAGGLLFSSKQNAMALANSLGVFGSTVDASSVSLADNTATDLSAQGGRLVANSVSVERGEGAGSTLSAATRVAGNTASQVSTGASSMAGPGKAFSEESVARAATNAVVLYENSRVDSGSPLNVSDNRATQVAAIGGTALVNALGAYRDAGISGSPITLSGNRADDVRTGGVYGQVAGIGSAKNGILVANGVYLEGENGVRLSGSPVAIRENTAQSLNADGGRVNANALAINGRGEVQGTPITLSDNRAENVTSEGKEGTFAGHAVIDRGVGYASANAVQVMGALRAGSLQLMGNTALRVTAEKGVALANSFMVDNDGSAQGVHATIAGNSADEVRTRDGKTALANSVLDEGRIDGSQLSIAANRSGAQADDGDAAAASVRNRKSGHIAGSQIAITGNQGSVSGKGTANGVDNGGSIGGSRIAIVGNRGSARGGGTINSVVNGGTIAGGQITILGNQGSADSGGVANSVHNEGRIGGSNIVIAGNSGTARGGTVNSVRNSRTGNIVASNIAIVGNRGTTNGGGTVNSVDNRGLMTGSVTIAGNQGTAVQGGTVNSLVNRGVMTGAVVIAGNRGTAMAGGVSNSVINRGAIAGVVTIVGNQSTAGVGMTTGTVRTTGGVMAGAAGVTGNTPWAANVGYTVTAPSTGVINRSVTVGPAVTVLNM